ncbi:MAG: hypothetical protein QM642_09385 [Edaphocola sp.]
MKPEAKAAKRRRYYLHRRIRLFARLSTAQRTIYIPCLHEPNEKQTQYFNELRATYGYAVQT